MTREEHYRAYYRTLGLEPGCTWPQLKAAYRRAVHTWHPDRFQDQPHDRARAEEKIKEVNYAFHRLAKYYRQCGILPCTPADTTASTITSRPYHKHRKAPQGSVARPKHTSVDKSPPDINPTLGRSPRQSYIVKGLLIVSAIVLGYTFFNDTTDPQRSKSSYLAPESTLKPKTSIKSGSDNVQVLPREETEPYGFTFGCSISDVLDIQGIPSRTEGNIIWYGSSRVVFEHGIVVDWESLPSDPLRTIVRTNFTFGSPEAEVRKIQGKPLHETKDVWTYRISKVYFKEGKVAGWYNSVLDPLKVEEKIEK
jgi:hypothetical protein